MPITLTNRRDIVADSVSIIDAKDINSILDLISGIVGNAPPSLNTVGKIAEAINKEPQLYNLLIGMINTKFPTSGIANYYTKQEVQRMFLDLIYNAPDSQDALKRAS